jgi:hypothetical protein
MSNPRIGRLTRSSALVGALLLLAGTLSAQEVGTVAAVEGAAEIGSGGAFTTAAIGSPVHRGDQLRTGTPGRLRVVFQDDSVLAISENSFVTVNEQVFNAESGKAKSFIELLQGKVSAVVSEYYHRAGNTYEIKTVTAVAGVRGTEFSMAYNPDLEVTEVVGISGHIEVHSMIDPTGPGILLTANEASTIPHGAAASPPRRIEETLFRQRMEGLDFIGAGRAEGLLAGRALASGASVPAADRAGAVGTSGSATGGITSNQTNRTSCIDPSAACLAGQPPDVIKNTTGQLGISLGHK